MSRYLPTYVLYYIVLANDMVIFNREWGHTNSKRTSIEDRIGEITVANLCVTLYNIYPLFRYPCSFSLFIVWCQHMELFIMNWKMKIMFPWKSHKKISFFYCSSIQGVSKLYEENETAAYWGRMKKKKYYKHGSTNSSYPRYRAVYRV